MEFSYRIEKEKAIIEKVLEPEAVAVIPEELEGYPVTELGAYVLSGSDVEELHLPSGLVKIGAYGCYNCRRLRRIFCYSRVNDLGAGVFAGVQTVEYLDFVLIRGERSCLKDVLSELRQTLRVRIREVEPEEVGAPGAGGRMYPVVREARLIFPEYFEDSVENTPARIVSVETHGCGHRYRYCFQKREFQYGDYDGIFPHVQVQEPEALVAELAFGRLRYPHGLTERNRRAYEEYLAQHWRMAGQILIGADHLERAQASNLEPGQLPWLVEQVLEPGLWAAGDESVPTEAGHVQSGGQVPCGDQKQGEGTTLAVNRTPERVEVISAYIAMAQQAGDTEMVSWLMDYRHRTVAGAGTAAAQGVAVEQAESSPAGGPAESGFVGNPAERGPAAGASACTRRGRPRRFEL